MRQTIVLALFMCLTATPSVAQVAVIDKVIRSAPRALNHLDNAAPILQGGMDDAPRISRGVGIVDQTALSLRGGSGEASNISQQTKDNAIASACGIYGAREFLVTENSNPTLQAAVKAWGDFLEHKTMVEARMGDGSAIFADELSQHKDELEARELDGTITDNERTRLLAISLYDGGGDFLECAESLK